MTSSYPEYLDADTKDEIIKAVRQNILFGAKVIKICVDCKPYGYTVDEMNLFIEEAAKAGFKVEGHIQTREGARRAIEAGLWSLAHDGPLDDELHKMMAAKGIWRAGTETPATDYNATSQQAFERTVGGLRNAYENGVALTFSTDADYFIPGMTRGDVVIDFLLTWKAAGIPDAEILKIMTINGYKWQRDLRRARPDHAGARRRYHRRPRQPARRHRRAARRPVRNEGRQSLQARRRGDARGVLQRRARARLEDTVRDPATISGELASDR